MLSARTVREQILPVLRATRDRVAVGVPVAEACRMAIHDRSRETGLAYQTILDSLRRRMGLPDIAALHASIAAWLEAGDDRLKAALLGAAEAAAHAEIARFFALAYPSAERQPQAMQGLAEAPAMRPGTIMLEGLSATVVDALEARARANGRPVEAEIAAILERVVRGGRRELATWSAGMRSRLADRYTGDSTADIRADRER